MASIRYVIWPFSCENSFGLTQIEDTTTGNVNYDNDDQPWDLEFPGSRQYQLKVEKCLTFQVSTRFRLPKLCPISGIGFTRNAPENWKIQDLEYLECLQSGFPQSVVFRSPHLPPQCKMVEEV